MADTYSNIPGISASDVLIPCGYGTPTNDDLQDFLNHSQSSGKITGGTISAHAGPDGTIDISEMEGLIYTTDAIGASYVFFKQTAVESLALTDLSVNYIYFDWNGGTPQYLATTDRSIIHEFDQFVVGRAWRSGNYIEIAPDPGVILANSYRRLHDRLVLKYGLMDRVSGAIIAAHPTPLRLQITAGSFYIDAEAYTTIAANTFEVYYKTGGVWTGSTELTLFSDVFDGGTSTVYEYYQNGDDIAALSGSKYGIYWIFLCPEGDLYVLLGEDDYPNIGAVQAATVPSVLPPYLTNWAILVGRVIIQNGGAAFYTVESSFSQSFTLSAATDHSSLANLTIGDPHTQYMYLIGRSGGQVLIGGVDANDDLTFQTTSDGTKGSYIFSELTTNGGILRTDASGVVTSSVTLPDGTLATTQAPLTNNTTLATTAYTDAAVAAGGGFDPDVDAFNIGNDAVSSGASSIGLGHDSDATGDRSIALGYGSQATAQEAIAIGDVADASGAQSIRIGDAGSSTNTSSISIGTLANATGTYSMAWGYNASAGFDRSFAVGHSSIATAAYGLAFGTGASAGDSSVALGRSALANGTTSGIAIGYTADAGGQYVVAVGHAANCSGDSSVALGRSAIVSAGSSIAIGYGCQANGAYTVSMGTSCITAGTNNVLIGRSCASVGGYSVVIGYSADNTSGDSGVAIGTNAQVTTNGTAVGRDATVSASGGTSIGYGSDATGAASVALGNSSQATAAEAVALGDGATCAFAKSVAIGDAAVATRINQIILGSTTNDDVTIMGGLFIEERATAYTDKAGFGQLWTYDDSGTTELWFTNDAGLDAQVHYGTLSELNVAYASEGPAIISSTCYATTDTYTGTLQLRKSASDSLGTPTDTASGDYLGAVEFYGCNTTPVFSMGAQIIGLQSAAASTFVPTDLVFTTSTGAALPTERLRINSTGIMNIGGGSYSESAIRGLTQKLEIHSSAVYGGMSMHTWATSNSQCSVLDFTKSGSATIGTHSIMAADEKLGYIIFRGSDGTAFRDAAVISADIDGTPGVSDMPGRLMFSTTADGAAVATERMRITNAGNVKIAGTALRATTEGTNHLDIFDGTAPVGTLANGISLYSTAGELRVMDAAGNSTLLSPHDKETNEWIYDSVDTTTGKRLRIDMERMMKAINKKFGWDFVKEFELPRN